MTPLTFFLAALAGGVGASARLLVDGVVRARFAAPFPFGTMIINVTGSLLLGVITGLAIVHVIPEELRLVLGGGFLGGYTTFSTASFETARLTQDRRYVAALANGLGMLVVSVLAAALGVWLGSQF